MKKKNILIGGLLLSAAGIVLWKFCKTALRGIIPVKPFDPEKYLGKWYEIARMDYRFERNLNNTTAQYSLNKDGSIHVINRGYNYKSNKWEKAEGKAKLAGSPDEGKLKVSFFGPFYSPYTIVALDPDYQYALVAGKNLNYLWLLSRTRTIPENIKQGYLQKARNLGYKTSSLIWVDHNL